MMQTMTSVSSFGDLAVFSYDCPAIAGRIDRFAGHFYLLPANSRLSPAGVAFMPQNQ
jgi:hypothetical protein